MANLGDSMQVKWRIDRDYITFETVAMTTGWMSIGLSANGGMGGADIVIIWINRDTGAATIVVSPLSTM
jgi:hypothetical protein